MEKSSPKKSKDARVSNYMEELAADILEDLLSQDYRGKRFTESAKKDIKALALNRLWPMYTTSPTGRDFLKKVVEEDRVEQDIVRELRAAISIVRSNPRS
ncbi:MAG: late competence development ComFB family protein [Candidatus Omnitrophota bacterium]